MPAEGSSRLDAVVVGGGHNGLTCAAYLARAGLQVTVLEARPDVGGCASTVPALGTVVNVCGCDHLAFRTTPIMDELDLAAHGLTYLDADPSWLAVGWQEGRGPWLGFADPQRTLDGIAATHPDSVAAYDRYLSAARPAAELVVELANHVPTPGNVVAEVLRRRGRGASTLVKWSKRSAVDVLRSFFASDEFVAPACVSGPAIWGVPPDAPGTGLAALSYAMRHIGRSGVPRGGSGMVPAALSSALSAAGGNVRTNSRVAAVLVDGDRVRGVRLDDGEELDAAVVVVACDARRALVSWLRDAPTAARTMVDRWRSQPVRDGSASKIDAIVVGEPPRPSGTAEILGRLGVGDATVPSAVIYPEVEDLASHHSGLAHGVVPDRPALMLDIPSALDQDFRPGPHEHLLSLEVLGTPYALRDGWEASREPDRWLRLLDSVCDQGTTQRVRRWRVTTPVDYERDFGLMRGKTPSFPGGPVAALRASERSRYRTAVRGLYLGGADTFPGAGIWGAPGRNAAAIVLADHGSRLP